MKIGQLYHPDISDFKPLKNIKMNYTEIKTHAQRYIQVIGCIELHFNVF